MKVSQAVIDEVRAVRLAYEAELRLLEVQEKLDSLLVWQMVVSVECSHDGDCDILFDNGLRVRSRWNDIACGGY